MLENLFLKLNKVIVFRNFESQVEEKIRNLKLKFDIGFF